MTRKADIESFVAEFLGGTRPAIKRPEYRFAGSEIARRFGAVYLNLDVTKSVVKIAEIRADKHRHGLGSLALEFLCGLADKWQVRLAASVEPFTSHAMTEDKLRDWYRRFGFNGDGYMVRLPNRRRV